MLADLPPYPSYEDSGFPGIGLVPDGWTVATLRRRLRSYDGIKIGPFGSQLKLEHMTPSGYKVYGQSNVIAGDFQRGDKYIDAAKFQELRACEIRPGDLVVTMMGTSGRCARVPEGAQVGVMDSHLLRVRADAGIDAGFLELVLDRAPYAKDQIEVAGKGSIMQGLNSSIVKDLVLGLPSLPEQTAIVTFLAYADRRIRRYIAAKKKLIHLLEEHRQAIIQRAVTRGLDPSIRLKPSGVEWLGDVPEHWTLMRFKYLVRVTSGQVDPRSPEHRDKILIAPNHIKSGTGRIVLEETADAQGADSGKYEVRRGQVVLSKIRPYLRKAAIARVDCLCSADMYPLEARESELRPEFLLMLLLSVSFTTFAVNCSLRAAMPKINRESLGDGWLWFPELREQDAILAGMHRLTTPVVLAIGQAERQITQMREYRTRLIADVVTGKLDVRDAAGRLPAEAGESEPVEEAEAMSDYEDGKTDDLDDIGEQAEA